MAGIDWDDEGFQVGEVASPRFEQQKKALVIAITQKIAINLNSIIVKAVEDAFAMPDEHGEECEGQMSDHLGSQRSLESIGAYSLGSSLSRKRRFKQAVTTSSSLRKQRDPPKRHGRSRVRPVGVNHLEASFGSRLLLDNLSSPSDDGLAEKSSLSLVPSGSVHSTNVEPSGEEGENKKRSPDASHPFATSSSVATGSRTQTTGSWARNSAWTAEAKRNILESQMDNVRHIVSVYPEEMVRPPWTHAATFLALNIVGVLPLHWSGSALRGKRIDARNRYIVFSLSGCVLCALAYALFNSIRLGGLEQILGRIMDLLPAVGSTVALMASWRLSDAFLGGVDPVLEMYVDRQRVRYVWCQTSSRRLFYSLLACTISCAIRLTWRWEPEETWIDVMVLGCFSFVNILYFGVSFSIFHVSCSLQFLVDAYCARFEHDGSPFIPDLSQSVKEWNILVVILRAASSRLGIVFLLLQTLAFGLVAVGAILAFLDSLSIAQILWNMPIVIIAQFAFFEVAKVTEKCKRVPAFVNSLNSGCLDEVDDVHHLVQHISYSGAGFDVFGVLVETSMAIKIFYVCCMSSLSILMRVVYRSHLFSA